MHDYEVIIIGGGQSGLALGHFLPSSSSDQAIRARKSL